MTTGGRGPGPATGPQAGRGESTRKWRAIRAGLGVAALSLGLVGCTSPGTTLDPAQGVGGDQTYPDYLDPNGDGVVTRAEWNQGFDAADANGDGRLDQGELQGGRGGRR